jgi:hypothetical protein
MILLKLRAVFKFYRAARYQFLHGARLKSGIFSAMNASILMPAFSGSTIIVTVLFLRVSPDPPLSGFSRRHYMRRKYSMQNNIVPQR